MIVVAMQTKLSFVLYILADSHYYNVPQNEVSSVMATTNSISEVVTIIQSLFLGVIVDTLGRKAILIIGLLFLAGGLGFIPLFTKVYPWYLILRIFIGLGISWTGNVPIGPDYVKPNSIGVSSSYGTIFVFIGRVISQSVIYKLATMLPLAIIFYSLGGVMSLTALTMVWGIKDIFKD
mmetsp:Transcript_32282/g.49421  ORF Transcript_32282/g.49421 Transcript_32282/m.49421 type:complete len:178 (-) Transcript_32282:867-1400(-)